MTAIRPISEAAHSCSYDKDTCRQIDRRTDGRISTAVTCHRPASESSPPATAPHLRFGSPADRTSVINNFIVVHLQPKLPQPRKFREDIGAVDDEIIIGL